MNIVEIKAEARREVYAEVIVGVEQLIALYRQGVPALAGHPIHDESKVAIPLLESFKEALQKQQAVEAPRANQ
jgi:hypothetical protein